MNSVMNLLLSKGKFELSVENFDKYVLVGPESDYGKVMWADIGKASNGVVLDHVLRNSGRLLNVLHHIHFSFAINNKFKLPFQNFWANRYSLNNEVKNDNTRYCIVFTDVSASRTDEHYLEELSERSNSTLVLILVNTICRRGEVIKRRLKYFEYVFSFDRKDCNQYGFIFHPTNYSTASISTNEPIENDAFFVGVSKGRVEQLTRIYQHILNAGGKPDFYISGVKKKDMVLSGIHYNMWLDYSQVLEHVRKSNCIIEVMDGDQDGVTLRMMEAVCYNKRLLTNNKTVKKSPFYKTGNIQVFEKIEDIDVEFITDRGSIDYNYDGEFSPLHLINHINREENKKND